MGPRGAADAGRICECITGKTGVRCGHMPSNPRAVQCPRMAARTDLEHKATSPKSVGCYVVTVSDTRTEETDTGGRAIVELLTAGGHRLVGRAIVKDDPDMVRGTVERQLANPDVQVIIT